MRQLLLICTIALTLCGCAKDTAPEGPAANTPSKRIYATFEYPETRTYIDSEYKIHWHAEDAISLFRGESANVRYLFEGATGDLEGSFMMDDSTSGTGEALDRTYAFYPYATTTSISADGSISYTIPEVQTYAVTTFARGANTMMAAADASSEMLSFKNCCGAIYLKLYGTQTTISSVTLEGNMSEPLSGAATFKMNLAGRPQTAMAATASSTVTVECSEGLLLSESAETPTVLYIMVPPTTFSEGFTITVTDDLGRTFTKTTDKSITIERNVIQPMAALEVTFEESTEENLYTTIAGTWKLTSWRGDTPNFEVYLDIAASGDVTLWQKIDSREWSCYESVTTLSNNVISGTYSDGIAWSTSYDVAVEGDNMTWTATIDSTDISVYSRAELPDTLPVTRSNTTGDDGGERFL